MPANLTVSAGTVLAFLLVLARVSGAMVFVPMPGFSGTPGMARAAFSLAFTLARKVRRAMPRSTRWMRWLRLQVEGWGARTAWMRV